MFAIPQVLKQRKPVSGVVIIGIFCTLPPPIPRVSVSSGSVIAATHVLFSFPSRTTRVIPVTSMPSPPAAFLIEIFCVWVYSIPAVQASLDLTKSLYLWPFSSQHIPALAPSLGLMVLRQNDFLTRNLISLHTSLTGKSGGQHELVHRQETLRTAHIMSLPGVCSVSVPSCSSFSASLSVYLSSLSLPLLCLHPDGHQLLGRSR